MKNIKIDKYLKKIGSDSERICKVILKYNRDILKYNEKFSNNGFNLIDKNNEINIILNKKKIIILNNKINNNKDEIKKINKKIKIDDNKIEFPISKMITDEIVFKIIKTISKEMG